MIDVQKIQAALEGATGADFIKAERAARILGDPTPSVVFSAKFQAILLANLLKVPVEDLEELPVKEFTAVIAMVNAFLFGEAQPVPQK